MTAPPSISCTCSIGSISSSFAVRIKEVAARLQYDRMKVLVGEGFLVFEIRDVDEES